MVEAQPQERTEPVDVDGVAVLTIGTALWAVAFLALLPFRSRLADNDADWWLWTCVAGVALGLYGVGYCRRRRTRRLQARRTQSSS